MILDAVASAIAAALRRSGTDWYGNSIPYSGWQADRTAGNRMGPHGTAWDRPEPDIALWTLRSRASRNLRIDRSSQG